MDFVQDNRKSVLSYVSGREEAPDATEVQHLESTIRKLMVQRKDNWAEYEHLYDTTGVREQERDEARQELKHQRAENRKLASKLKESERPQLTKELDVDGSKTANRKLHPIRSGLLDDSLYTVLDERCRELENKHERVQTRLDERERRLTNLTAIHSKMEKRLKKDIRGLEGALTTKEKLIGRYAYRVDELESQFNGDGRIITKEEVKSETPETKSGELQSRQAETERATTAGTKGRPVGVPTLGKPIPNFLGGLVAGILLTAMLVRFAFLTPLADAAGRVWTTIDLVPKSTDWPTPNNVPYWPGFFWYYILGYCPEWWIKLVWNLAWCLKR